MFNQLKAVPNFGTAFKLNCTDKMNTKTESKSKEKQSKIKSNTKQALEYMKSKNKDLQYLIDAFNLELSQINK